MFILNIRFFFPEGHLNLYAVCRRNRCICLAAALLLLAAAAASTVLGALVAGGWFIARVFLYLFAAIAACLIASFQHRSFAFGNHHIEIYLGLRSCFLLCDGKILDRYVSLVIVIPRLHGTVNGHQIDVAAHPGLLAPLLTLYIDGVRQLQFR